MRFIEVLKLIMTVNDIIYILFKLNKIAQLLIIIKNYKSSSNDSRKRKINFDKAKKA